MTTGSRRGRSGALACLAAVLAIHSVVASALAGDPDPGFSPGDRLALNAICSEGRSGRSWTLVPPDPVQPHVPGAMAETVIPAIGRTDIVNVRPGAIVPCVRVTVATDAGGVTAYDLAADADNVNREFTIQDIHTGEPLELCPAEPSGGAGGAGPASAGFAGGGELESAPGAHPHRRWRFSPGHELALNGLSGDGRSGRSWELLPSGSGGTEAMAETIVPAIGRTDIVNIMPSAIIPCVRVTVATDGFGMTAYELEVDADNVNRDFTIADIHTGEALRFCPRRR